MAHIFLLWLLFFCSQNIVAATEYIVEEDGGIIKNYFPGNYVKTWCGGVRAEVILIRSLDFNK